MHISGDSVTGVSATRAGGVMSNQMDYASQALAKKKTGMNRVPSSGRLKIDCGGRNGTSSAPNSPQTPPKAGGVRLPVCRGATPPPPETLRKTKSGVLPRIKRDDSSLSSLSSPDCSRSRSLQKTLGATIKTVGTVCPWGDVPVDYAVDGPFKKGDYMGLYDGNLSIAPPVGECFMHIPLLM